MKNYFGKNLKFLREKKGLSQRVIAELTGKAETSVGAWEKDISEPSFTNIQKMLGFFEVSADDMLFKDLSNESLINKGGYKTIDSLNESLIINAADFVNKDRPAYNATTPDKVRLPQVVVTDPQGQENIVFVPVKARAGYLAGYGDPEYIQKLPSYRLPGLNNGTFRAFEVSGVSMESLLYEGDVVVCKWVEKLADVRERDIYVLLTESEGIAIKRVLSHIVSANKMLLGSENPLYSAILLDYEKIHEIWQPITYMSTHFRTQNSLEVRLFEVETRLMRLEEKQHIHPLK